MEIDLVLGCVLAEGGVLYFEAVFKNYLSLTTSSCFEEARGQPEISVQMQFVSAQYGLIIRNSHLKLLFLLEEDGLVV